MRSTPSGLVASALAPLLTILLLAGCADNAAADCSVRLKEMTDHPPLLLRPGSPLNVSGFVAPDADHVLRLRTNETILLACPGANNQLLFANSTTGFRQVNASCAWGSVVAVRGAEHDLRTAACARHAERTAERDGQRRCGADGRGQRVRIGFRLLTGFLELVGACFDDRLLAPIYSNYTLVQGRAGGWAGREAVDFRAGRFFGGVDPAAQFAAQRRALQELQGRQRPLDTDVLTSAPLAPDAGPALATRAAANIDFYVNAAPQWRSVNAGAWAAVESAARRLAAARGDLLVVTGVYGVGTLSDAQGSPTPVFLYAHEGQRKMPVPALYWKVLYDPRSGKGAAVVGNNNPWAPLAAHPELRLCADVCARLRWLPAPPPPEVYCCEVDTLRQRVKDVPPLDTRGLLEGADAATTEAPTSETTFTDSPSTEDTSTETYLGDSPSSETHRIVLAAGSSLSTALECCTFVLLCALLMGWLFS